MTTLGMIVAMAAGVYALRLSGFVLAGAALPGTFERALTYVPVATLTALVVADLVSRPADTPVRAVAVAVGGLVLWRVGRPWLGILAGVGSFWLVRLF